MRQGQCAYCNDILADFEDDDPIGAERCIKCRRHGNSIVAEWTPALTQPQGHPSISTQQDEDAFPIPPVLPMPDFGGNGFDPGSNGSSGGDGGFGGFGGGDFGGGGAGDNF